MADKDHKKWIEILSVGTPVQREDASDVFDPPESFLLLPDVQIAPERLGSDEFDFKASDGGEETAFGVTDVLVSSYQTGGSGSTDRDVVPEPDLTPDFGMADHFDFI
ncbi:hypothetical protein ACSQ76_10940 [Roseovarius sp. B08]|uniref:hypothetical protein n=1 Tax=Roseovarius sp. B08 TaxID=3449223 RepID=UPI003EDB7668